VNKNLETQCNALRAERITFAQFVDRTRSDFVRLANHLLRLWPSPAWMVPEDLVQELYLGVWIALPDFDPDRGPTLARYLTWNAMHRAKRALHKARGASIHGSADKAPSNIEKPLSWLGEPGDGDLLAEVRLAEPPTAERTMIALEDRTMSVDRALAACTSATERVAIIALEEGGDVDGAARILYDNLPFRVALGFGNPKQATRYVTRAVRAVAQRLDADAS
jgi:DNA-directed RNA polymerase specialized sigma24 family protein